MLTRLVGTRALAAAAVALLAFAAVSSVQAQPKDILFYGNSHTIGVGFGSTRSVPNLVSDLAVAGGFPAPRTRNASVGGQSLQWHLQNNTSHIFNGIPASERWETVVLQDFSTQPTTLGSVATHLSSSLGLYQAVAAHSPGVVPVLFETWARGPGHAFYTGGTPSFPGGPAQMQQQVRDGYLASQGNINATVGSDLALLAPVGDAWEDAGFPLNFYATDRQHAQNRGTLLAALVLYGTIYGDSTTSDLNLSGVLTALSLTAQDGAQLTSLADGVLVPEPHTAALAVVLLAMVPLGRLRGARSSG
jgi:hypothetical protein